MLKLQARKQKQQEIQAATENVEDPSAFLERAALEGMHNPEQQLARDIAFNNERKSWLKKLHDENQLLLQLLDVSCPRREQSPVSTDSYDHMSFHRIYKRAN